MIFQETVNLYQSDEDYNVISIFFFRAYRWSPKQVDEYNGFLAFLCAYRFGLAAKFTRITMICLSFFFAHTAGFNKSDDNYNDVSWFSSPLKSLRNWNYSQMNVLEIVPKWRNILEIVSKWRNVLEIVPKWRNVLIFLFYKIEECIGNCSKIE